MDEIEEEPRPRGPLIEDFAAAAALAQPFMAYLVYMRFRAPPTETQWARADPVLKLLPHEPTLWFVPLLGVALTVVLFVLAFPTWRIFKQALIGALVGAIVVGGAIALLVKLGSPHWPAFLRGEESAAPGITLNMAAGYGEELIVRLGVLPLAFSNFSTRSRWVAVLGASILTGLAFALLHEAGSEGWSPALFAMRFAIPGVLMSIVALLTKPSFVVIAHCTAHVLVPIYFA